MLQAQRNQYNEVSAKVQKLKDMVEELNRIHTDNEPMFVHYKLDTRARIEHFFAQARAECGNTLVLEENITRENANRNYNTNRWLNNRPNTDDGYNFRGRGLLHLTFRDNYHSCTTYLHNQGWLDNDIDFEAQPQLVTDSGVYALLSAVYYWNTKTYPSEGSIVAWRNMFLYEIANTHDDNDLQDSITRNGQTFQYYFLDSFMISHLINGGYNNLLERQLAFYRIRFNRIYNTLLEARNDTNKNKDDGIFKDFET